MQGILGQKKMQTQKFRTDGKRIPVTVVEVEANPVIAVKSIEKDGYFAVQLGYGTQKNPNKPMQGHIKGASVKAAPRFLREVRMTEGEEMPAVGEKVELSTVLQPGDIIDVEGVSKGKGFAGGVKRYHFKGGPKTHGQSDRHRAPGSIGSGTTPGRVYKGKRMAGKMGFEQVTVQNLTVAWVDGSTLYINGLIPGAIDALVKIVKKGEDKKFVPLIEAAEKDAAVAAEAERIAQEQAAQAAAEEARMQEQAAEAEANAEEAKQEEVAAAEATEAVAEEAKAEEAVQSEETKEEAKEEEAVA